VTSLEILEKPIAHKGSDKPMGWIQNAGVGPEHEIPKFQKRNNSKPTRLKTGDT
jgi:hypothetical protein